MGNQVPIPLHYNYYKQVDHEKLNKKRQKPGNEVLHPNEVPFLPTELWERILNLLDIESVGNLMNVDRRFQYIVWKLIQKRQIPVKHLMLDYPSIKKEPDPLITIHIRAHYDCPYISSRNVQKFSIRLSELFSTIVKYSPKTLEIYTVHIYTGTMRKRMEPLKRLPAWWLRNVEKLEISGEFENNELLCLLELLPSLNTFGSNDLKKNKHSIHAILARMNQVHNFCLKDDKSSYSDDIFDVLIWKSHDTYNGLQRVYLSSDSSTITAGKLIEFLQRGNFCATKLNLIYVNRIVDPRQDFVKWLGTTPGVTRRNLPRPRYVFSYREYNFEVTINKFIDRVPAMNCAQESLPFYFERNQISNLSFLARYYYRTPLNLFFPIKEEFDASRYKPIRGNILRLC